MTMPTHPDARPGLLSTWRTAGYQGPRTIDADAVAARTDASGGLVAALADGVGDSAGAARAARLAVTAAVAVPAADGPVAALLAARAAVEADPEAGDAVLVVAQPFGLGYRLAWVGDVRAYAWDGRVLLALTTDHTLAQYFRDRGTVPSPAMEHQVLTSVRTAAPAEYGLASLAIPARLLFTSDGVHKTLSHELMTAIMRGATGPGGRPGGRRARGGHPGQHDGRGGGQRVPAADEPAARAPRGGLTGSAGVSPGSARGHGVLEDDEPAAVRLFAADESSASGHLHAISGGGSGQPPLTVGERDTVCFVNFEDFDPERRIQRKYLFHPGANCFFSGGRGTVRRQ